MKIIISHDIDHITTWEHYKDLIIPKFYIRSFIEFFSGYITFNEITGRFMELISNKLHNINELLLFDRKNSIPSTFFIGVENSLGLSYSIRNAKKWADEIIANGFDVGVHGINYAKPEKVVKEKEKFKDITNLKEFGIRMHYLRTNKNTLEYLADSGFLFDSTVFKLKKPYKIRNMWEFPAHIMDSYIIQTNGRQRKGLSEIIDDTISIIKIASDNELPYLIVLFHDRYFSDNFLTWKKWYIWLIDWLKSQGYEFITFRTAITELEGKINKTIIS